MTIFKMILRYFKNNSSKFREITRNIILGITHSLVYLWFNLSTDVPRIFFRRFRAEMEFLDMPQCHVFPMSNGFRGRKPAAYKRYGRISIRYYQMKNDKSQSLRNLRLFFEVLPEG